MTTVLYVICGLMLVTAIAEHDKKVGVIEHWRSILTFKYFALASVWPAILVYALMKMALRDIEG